MNHKLYLFLLALIPVLTSAQNSVGGFNVDRLLRQMTLKEKVRILVGTGMPGVEVGMPVIGSTRSLVPGAAGTTYPIPRLGIPAIVLSDGPAGLRIDSHRDYDHRTYYCTAFPIGNLLSSTWNLEAVKSIGQAYGQEARAYGVDVVLGPGNNIQRNPLCGRNYEYFSEDPLLSGLTATAYIQGVQSEGVGVSLKHFVCNNQETKRLGNDAQVGMRALREIYLKAFEIPVKKARPWTIMSSYNKLNGAFTGENRWLLTDILRQQWGYQGLVMTDWFGGKNRSKAIMAGNDMFQPGLPFDPDSIMAGIKDGRISMQQLDQSVRRVLELIAKTHRVQGEVASLQPDLDSHAELTRQVDAEGTVLLKNNGVLPLTKGQHVALYGAAGYDLLAGGTGSGRVNAQYIYSLVEGLRTDGCTLDSELLTFYTDSMKAFQKAHANDEHSWWQGNPRMSELSISTDSLKRQARDNDVAVVVIGRESGEDHDRKLEEYSLNDKEKNLLQQVADVFHAMGKKMVVVLNVGDAIETASWKSLPDAILLPWQGGQEAGLAIADVLTGRSYPSGKLPMTWAIDVRDHWSSKNMPLNAPSIMPSIGQKDQPENRRNIDYTVYEEGIYVGYRYFNTYKKAVSYPFGYGLSYTSFGYSEPKLEYQGDSIHVMVTVKNIGNYRGKEVVQLYVKAPRGNLDKPENELKAFAKTLELAPGHQQRITLSLAKDDLASFSEKQDRWVLAHGTYHFLICSDCRTVKCTTKLKL
ncbi:MAG: beta-glucosidase [Prevotella sp.]|jgi:beta-glucosidase